MLPLPHPASTTSNAPRIIGRQGFMIALPSPGLRNPPPDASERLHQPAPSRRPRTAAGHQQSPVRWEFPALRGSPPLSSMNPAASSESMLKNSRSGRTPARWARRPRLLDLPSTLPCTSVPKPETSRSATIRERNAHPTPCTPRTTKFSSGAGWRHFHTSKSRAAGPSAGRVGRRAFLLPAPLRTVLDTLASYGSSLHQRLWRDTVGCCRLRTRMDWPLTVLVTVSQQLMLPC